MTFTVFLKEQFESINIFLSFENVHFHLRVYDWDNTRENSYKLHFVRWKIDFTAQIKG